MSEYHLGYRLAFLARIWWHDVRKAARWQLRRRFGWRVTKRTVIGGIDFTPGAPIPIRTNPRMTDTWMIPDGGYEAQGGG